MSSSSYHPRTPEPRALLDDELRYAHRRTAALRRRQAGDDHAYELLARLQ